MHIYQNIVAICAAWASNHQLSKHCLCACVSLASCEHRKKRKHSNTRSEIKINRPTTFYPLIKIINLLNCIQPKWHNLALYAFLLFSIFPFSLSRALSLSLSLSVCLYIDSLNGSSIFLVVWI